MARVRGRGNKSTELRLISLFRQHGIKGWRRGRQLPGNPDFVFPSCRVALFVDGCFWHGCPEHYRRPKSSQDFWDAKAKRNSARDATVNDLLQACGWLVVRLWEHDLWPARQAAALAKLIAVLGDRVESPHLHCGPQFHQAAPARRSRVAASFRSRMKGKGNRPKRSASGPLPAA